MPKRKAKAIVEAGTKLVAAAASRTRESGSPKVKPEDLLEDPNLERQGTGKGQTRRAQTPRRRDTPSD